MQTWDQVTKEYEEKKRKREEEEKAKGGPNKAGGRSYR